MRLILWQVTLHSKSAKFVIIEIVPGCCNIDGRGGCDRCLVMRLEEDEMHLLTQRILGIAILFLLVMLVIAKRVSTGSILDKPKGSLLVQLVNIFNLFFLLVVNPLAAILLITELLETLDPTHLHLEESWILIILESIGLVMYLAGFFLMAWALVTLGHNYQLGGSAPRSEDRMVSDGPYRILRHPMYTAALSISLGLACLIQSWAFLGVFCIYLVLILLLIPMEEEKLQKAYGKRYLDYQHTAGKILPYLH
jgi:protein-S-isoprenylcysteine O-methyltransferase Ste14